MTASKCPPNGSLRTRVPPEMVTAFISVFISAFISACMLVRQEKARIAWIVGFSFMGAVQ